MTINDKDITSLAICIQQQIENLSYAEREGNYLNIIRAASMIEDAGRKIGWRALELENKNRYLLS